MMEKDVNTGTIYPRRLSDLLTYPREELDIELKGWINITSKEGKANLAQAMLALANHGGGYVLIGFTETGGVWTPEENRPASLDFYNQDDVNGIVKSYADPVFHCDVHHIEHPSSGLLYPIVQVPGEHRVPIRALRSGPEEQHVRKDTYYIRRPGPASEPIQTSREWDVLIGRCVRAAKDDLLEAIRSIMCGLEVGGVGSSDENEIKNLVDWDNQSKLRWTSLLEERFGSVASSPYAHGVWTVSYGIKGALETVSLAELKTILENVKGHETGWPCWWVPTRSEIAPYPQDGSIECWMIESSIGGPGHSDFWRATPDGMMFLLRGYQEDDEHETRNVEPGTLFDLTLPIWRVGECLLHAARLSLALGDEQAEVDFQVNWSGLAGRSLVALANPSRMSFSSRTARQDAVTTRETVNANLIAANLPSLVARLTKPVYELFDFYEMPHEIIEEELAKMRSRSR